MRPRCRGSTPSARCTIVHEGKRRLNGLPHGLHPASPARRAAPPRGDAAGGTALELGGRFQPGWMPCLSAAAPPPARPDTRATQRPWRVPRRRAALEPRRPLRRHGRARLRRDLDRRGAGRRGFAADYGGRSPPSRRSPRPAPGSRTRCARYEALDDELGRAASYAQPALRRATRRTPRARSSSATRRTASPRSSSELLFFTLELNAIADAALDRAARRGPARPLAPLARRHPPRPAPPARRPARAAVPREGRDGPRRLDAALRRDDHALRFDGRRRGAAAGADPEPAAGSRTAARASAPRRRWARRWAPTSRTFALITNTLSKDREIADRWRGFADVAELAPPVEPRRARGGGGAGSRPCGPPIRACRTATTP